VTAQAVPPRTTDPGAGPWPLARARGASQRGRMDSALPDDMVELDARHCWERLRAAGMGRLAVVVDDAPEIFPVDHAVDDTADAPRILVRTAAGTKLFAADGRDVAFEVDGVDTLVDGEHAWSVVAKGVAETIRDPVELARRATLPPRPRWRSVKPHLLAIHVTSVSGRSFPVDPGPTPRADL
jgi:uncharacterized protein